MPLPPYIHREDRAGDRERYQTVYARERGSVAAPTAGLHFTPEILDEIRARGVEVASVTLHVGLGTFQPVRVERVEDVRLHAERYTIAAETAAALNAARREGRRIVAAGTTTVRTLEHCAAEVARSSRRIPGRRTFLWRRDLNFAVVGALLTNFHLPQSIVTDAGECVCGTGAGAGGVSACGGGEVSVLFLWGLHVRAVRKARG